MIIGPCQLSCYKKREMSAICEWLDKCLYMKSWIVSLGVNLMIVICLYYNTATYLYFLVLYRYTPNMTITTIIMMRIMARAIAASAPGCRPSSAMDAPAVGGWVVGFLIILGQMAQSFCCRPSESNTVVHTCKTQTPVNTCKCTCHCC